MDSFSHNDEHGQVLLVVVLVMVVALTVGLSLASRSIIHLKTSTEGVESQKAFSAAEAGIEQVLQSNADITSPQNLGNNAFIQNAKVTQLGNASSFLMNNGETVHQDDGGDIWLTAYDPNPNNLYQSPKNWNLNIYWGTQTGCSDAALEIIVLAGTKSNPTIDHRAFDACPGRQSSNNFSIPASGSYTISGQAFKYQAVLPITSGLFVRVVPLYTDTKIGVQDTLGNTFPTQGQIVTAVGTAGTTQRKVSLFQAYESTPTEFFYTLFSTQ